MKPVDAEKFYAQLLKIAHRTLPYCGGDAHLAARAALTEAHGALSQRDFFTRLDALGGHGDVTQRLAADLED